MCELNTDGISTGNEIACGTCKQFETPHANQEGYDPNWISCMRVDNTATGEEGCFCFHPNQGHDNGDFGNGWNGKEGATLTPPNLPTPTELPKTGQDTVGIIPFVVVATIMVCVSGWLIHRWKRS